jgi:hypothetical protein
MLSLSCEIVSRVSAFMDATNNQLLGRMLQEAQGWVCLPKYSRVITDGIENDCLAVKTVASEAPAPLLDATDEPSTTSKPDGTDVTKNEEERPLKPLTEISWPPEPDASVFTDPLKRDDPKPLRREELMRIGKLISTERAWLTLSHFPRPSTASSITYTTSYSASARLVDDAECPVLLFGPTTWRGRDLTF